MGGRYLGQKIVSMTWIGDGGTSTGAFHEGLNLAAVQRAPFVLIVENNQWAYSTPVSRQAPLRDFADRARAYGIASYIVDGNDVVAVWRTAREAVEQARRGEGPVLIESKTMRMTGHAQHDAAEYVPREMLEYWKARDPLSRYEKYLSQHELWNEKDKTAIDERIESELAADLEFAENSPFPPPELAEEGVYCEGCHTVEAEWRRAKEELMPPKSSVKPEWTISSFGAMQVAGGSHDRPPHDRRQRSGRAAGFGHRAKTCAAGANGSQEQSAGPCASQGAEIAMAQVTYLDAIRQALLEEMDRDPAVLLIGEDIGVYGGAFKATAGLLERFGWERVIDTPISETAIVGAAVGMSYLGLRPVAEMQFIDFIACAFNQITNFAAKSHYRWGAPVPIVIRGPAGGGVHGSAFHSANPEMYFVHTPGLKVVYPATPYDAKGLLKSAIRDNNPVLFFEHKFLYRRIKEEVPEGDYTVPIGQAIVRRPGRDLTIVTYAAMVHASLDAAAQLAREGIEAEVVDLRTLLPLDRETIIESVRRTSKLLVVHEDTRTGGIAGEIAAVVTDSAFEDLDGPVRRVTSLDTPVPFSPPLEEHFLPNAERIAAAARDLARY